MRRRTLVLKKEPLQDLSSPQLAGLVAGAPPTRFCETAALTCTIEYSLRYCEVPTVLPELCIRPV